jgi:hypothetical protein
MGHSQVRFFKPMGAGAKPSFWVYHYIQTSSSLPTNFAQTYPRPYQLHSVSLHIEFSPRNFPPELVLQSNYLATKNPQKCPSGKKFERTFSKR